MHVLAAASTTTPPAPFVDWGLMGKIALVSIIAGVGLVVAFSIGLAALSVARANHRSAPLRVVSVVLSVAMVAVVVGALVWGLELIVHKS